MFVFVFVAPFKKPNTVNDGCTNPLKVARVPFLFWLYKETKVCNRGTLYRLISITLAQLRFGVALSAIRTKNLQKVKKRARKFLRREGGDWMIEKLSMLTG